MLRRSLFLMVVCAVLVSALQGCESKNKMPDFRESFSYKDVRPFGTAVAYRTFSSMYAPQKMEINKQPFADNYGWDYDTASLYINISRNYFFSERDAQSLLDFTYKGNTSFISANNFDTLLLNKLFCKQNEGPSFSFGYLDMRNTFSKFSDSLTLSTQKFGYFYHPFSNFFTEINGSYARVVGYNDAGKANFFVFLWGKGRIYFHNEPRALSNYFLLTQNNYQYLQQIIKMFPPSPANIYWDNFYSNKNYVDSDSDGASTIGTLMKYPPLAKAFFIALALLLLYILFNSKRRQRIVPVIAPVQNTSIAFAEAIAGLYLNKKDNKIIGEKIINYFNEHIRSKYFISLSINTVDYAEQLSKKTGVDIADTEKLVGNIRTVQVADKVSDEQLLHLNASIEKFFKNT